MMSIPTLGIDISKAKFDVALLRDGKYKHKRFSNDAKGQQALLDWLGHQGVESIHACLEATGIYGEPLAEFLVDAGCTVSLVNPARIKGFAQSELVRTKTDKADAALIARFCAAMQPAAWQPQPKDIRQLRDLVRRLEALIDMRQQERNRLEAAHGLIKEQLQAHVSYLNEQIKQTRRLINQHIDNHPDLKDRKQLLATIPGIGEATIHVILAEFGDITRFKSAKALAAFVGAAPRLRQSGTSLRERGMLSKVGRSALRKAFFMPALVALRYNPLLIAMKQRLTAAGKPKMTIVGAAMRKLIHIVYGVLKSKTPFDPQPTAETA
jgi:transposase